MDNKSIKNNIRKLRRERGYSQEYVADSMKISKNAYVKIEKGDTTLISERVFQLADILEISIEELILGYPVTKSSIDKKITESNILYRQDIDSEIIYLKSTIDQLRKELKAQEELIKAKNQIIELQANKLANPE